MLDAPAQNPTWLTEGNEKRSRVKSMFAELASRYDLLNSLISFRLHYRWRNLAAGKLGLRSGDRVLDLCCGTGSFSRSLLPFIGGQGKIVGLDFCLPMIEIGNRNRPKQASYSLGDALALPVASQAFDGVTVGWGIRNVVDIDAAHEEIFRVLRPGAKFASIDTAQPENAIVKAISARTLLTLVPLMAGFFGKRKAYLYLPKSTERFRSRQELVDSMTRAGFLEVSWQNLMFGNVCIHWGQKP